MAFLDKTISALRAVEDAMREEYEQAKLVASARGVFEDGLPEVVEIRERLERSAAHPAIASIDQPTEAS